jgi:hypothetical protein
LGEARTTKRLKENQMLKVATPTRLVLGFSTGRIDPSWMLTAHRAKLDGRGVVVRQHARWDGAGRLSTEGQWKTRYSFVPAGEALRPGEEIWNG